MSTVNTKKSAPAIKVAQPKTNVASKTPKGKTGPISHAEMKAKILKSKQNKLNTQNQDAPSNHMNIQTTVENKKIDNNVLRKQ